MRQRSCFQSPGSGESDSINSDWPIMTAFGAGTLPSMLSASFLFGKLGPCLRGWLLKGAALFVIALGVSTLWQGLRYYAVMRSLIG